MILAFDIGNTNIVLGCLDGSEILFQTRISTSLDKTDSEYAVFIKNILDLYKIDSAEVEGAIISSVVPPLINVFRQVLLLLTGKNPLVVGPGVKTGLNITIDNPSQLGSDLVVAAVAALQKYEKPLIILDMGTATTLSVVDAVGDFQGVIIYPGVMVSFEALTKHTSQLPRISFEEPRNVIGKSSIDSMQSGLIYGTAAMLDGLIERIEEELGMKATVVATGGLSESITPHCKKNIICDGNLLLEGLKIIYEKNKKIRR
ncbi:MAG: type III pantothenate kinase [Clostridiales bacterium]|jgi:type III pantothenate kinase|nr:type III pantothenate kinase [Clostridiales bacterium]